MASPFSEQFPKNLELDVCDLDGYISLDASSNVVATFPTSVVSVAGLCYTRLKGAQKTLPVHTSTGIYTIAIDEPWMGLLDWHVSPGWSDHSITAVIPSLGGANVTGSQSSVTEGLQTGNLPGADPTVAIQTVIIHFTSSTGTLTDPPANTGFFVHFRMKRNH